MSSNNDSAVFVFGAGATRGCSFVDATVDPCLPFLDRDFFIQLQRVRNDKHRQLVRKVMGDVVKVFGLNFQVTMETVFTTFEHTARMLKVTGDNRDFKKAELRKMSGRLRQAIAAVLEEGLMQKDASGHVTRTPKRCCHHKRFVSDILSEHDTIISFNYDCVLDFALKNHGVGKWNARYGYGLGLGARGKLLTGDDYWQPDISAAKDETVHLYKLHGSLHFQTSGQEDKPQVHLKERPYTKQAGNLRFEIIPPEWHKQYDKGLFSNLWSKAADALNRARHVVFVGYSSAPTDLHSTALFRTSVKKGKLKSLVVVNPDRDARYRTRGVLQRGLSATTKVLSFDKLKHFVAAPRDTWDS